MAGGVCMMGGHAWQGACVAGGMCGGGNVWQGGMHCGGVCGRGHAWWGGGCVAGKMAFAADGTHPIGMHTCLLLNTS